MIKIIIFLKVKRSTINFYSNLESFDSCLKYIYVSHHRVKTEQKIKYSFKSKFRIKTLDDTKTIESYDIARRINFGD